MGRKYVNVDRQTPMLLPPDVREWVADNELAPFVLEAVEATNLTQARVNVRGTGDAQYPPGLMRAAFVRVLELAREVGLLKIGTVSVDGTKIAAAAAKRPSRL